jgi:predicted nucleic acid-binding protein
LEADAHAFITVWEMIRIVDLSEEVLQIVRDCVLPKGLRALDAIHLASALFLQSHLNERLGFVCEDHRLCEAAEAEHLAVLVLTSEG